MDTLIATTVANPLTIGFDTPPRSRAETRDSFWSQTPLALLAFAAAAAIVAVNRPADAPAARPAPVIVSPTVQADSDPLCSNCGEIVSVQLVSLHPDVAPTIKTFELNVRMNDGTLRVVRQFAPVFERGDRVRLDRSQRALRG